MNQPSSKPLILLVDDDPSIRLFCSATLKKAGYSVLEAEGSCEAMACHQSSKPPIDLLLSDLFLPPPDFQMRSASIQYPRVNGHELVHQALSVQKELRVLLMSSHPLASLTAQGIAVQPEHFLHKPFSAEALLEHVAKALASGPIRLQAPSPSPTVEVRWAD